jgi:hypothetical protein
MVNINKRVYTGGDSDYNDLVKDIDKLIVAISTFEKTDDPILKKIKEYIKLEVLIEQLETYQYNFGIAYLPSYYDNYENITDNITINEIPEDHTALQKILNNHKTFLNDKLKEIIDLKENKEVSNTFITKATNYVLSIEKNLDLLKNMIFSIENKLYNLFSKPRMFIIQDTASGIEITKLKKYRIELNELNTKLSRYIKIFDPLNQKQSEIGGGYTKIKIKNKKNILGKERCIYKISGNRKEYVKYKGDLITVNDYKKIIKLKNKK